MKTQNQVRILPRAAGHPAVKTHLIKVAGLSTTDKRLAGLQASTPPHSAPDLRTLGEAGEHQSATLAMLLRHSVQVMARGFEKVPLTERMPSSVRRRGTMRALLGLWQRDVQPSTCDGSACRTAGPQDPLPATQEGPPVQAVLSLKVDVTCSLMLSRSSSRC